MNNDEQPKLGDGSRFARLKSTLSSEKGVKNPAALAAWIGRKRYGNTKFSQLAQGKK